MLHKPNIVDIAEKSGFSITTVSRVLNGKADKYRISKETQQIIQNAAEELNYVPNEFARNLRTGKSKSIALIVPSLRNPFFAEIACVVNAEVRKYNYITLIGDSDDNLENEKAEVIHLSSRNPRRNDHRSLWRRMGAPCETPGKRSSPGMHRPLFRGS